MMRSRLRKATALLLSLCMAVTLLPVGALATETVGGELLPTLPTELEAVTATVDAVTWPADKEKPGSISFTSANLFPTANRRVYFQFTGLEPDTTYYYSASLGDTVLEEHTGYHCGSDGVMYTYLDLSEDTVAADTPLELTITLASDYRRDSETGEYAYHTVFAPVTFTTCLLTQMPAVTVAELNPERKLLSTAELTSYVNLYLPDSWYDTLYAAEVLSAQLAGAEDGLVYAETTQTAPYFTDNAVDYPGYDQLFGREDAYIYHTAVSFSSRTLYATRDLKPGLYDLKIYGDGKLLYTVEDAAEAVDCPLLTMQGNSYSLYPNIPGENTAYVQVSLSNGDPADFRIQLYDGDTLLGTSTAYHVASAGNMVASVFYEIPLSEALESKEYTLVPTASKTFSTTGSDTMYIGESAGFVDVFHGSRYYANVVALTFGYEADETYKATLSEYYGGPALATAYASPDENGLFDIEFTDESGELLEVQPNQDYCFTLYTRDYKGNWNTFGSSTNLWIRDREDIDLSGIVLQSEPETMPVELIGTANVSFYGNCAEAWFRISAGSSAAADLTDGGKFSLKLTNSLGESYTLTGPDADIRLVNNGAQKAYTLTFAIPDSMPHAHYTGELFYDGALLVDSTGKNILEKPYSARYDSYPYANIQSYNGSLGLGYNGGVYGYSLTADTLTLELFRLTNRTATPDHTLTVAAPANRGTTSFTPQQLTSLSPITRYRAVAKENGVPIASSDYGYFAADEDLWQAIEELPTYSVTPDSALEHGTLAILHATLPDTPATTVPLLSEVYVQAIPEAGYRMKAGSLQVNGETLLGRGFPVTEDCVVTCEFEPIPEEEYTISVDPNTYYGTITPHTATAAEGQTVSVTITPGNDYYLVDMNTPPYYTVDGDSTYTQTELTPHENGTFSFTMPAGNVTLHASFRTAETWYVSTSTESYYGGSISASSTSPYELSDTIITVSPDTGYTIDTLTAMYYATSGGSITWSLLDTPGEEPNTYVLTLPSADSGSDYLYMYVTATFKEAEAYTIYNYTYTNYGYMVVDYGNSAYAGSMVTMYPYLYSDSYRVKPGSVYVTSDSDSSSIPLTALGDDSYSFQMPESAVTIWAEFEEIPNTAPGGTVTDVFSLITALGGMDNASITDNTVCIYRSMTLEHPIVVTGGELVLDLNGQSLIGPENGSPVSVSGGSFTITNSASGMNPVLLAGDDAPVVSVSGGTAAIQATNISLRTTDGATAPAISVSGGTLSLGGRSENGFLSLIVEGQGSASGLLVSGGSASILSGTVASANSHGVVVQNGGSLTVSGGSLNSYSGQHAALKVDSSATGSVTMTGGTLDGFGTCLHIDSTGASVTLAGMATGLQAAASFQAPAGKGLQDYLVNGSTAIDRNSAEPLTEEQLSAQRLTCPIQVNKAYSITVNQAANGNVIVPSAGLTDSTVKVRVIPEPGYAVGSITYTEEGSGISYGLSSTPALGYFFDMPAANVTIDVSYIPVSWRALLESDLTPAGEDTWFLYFRVPQEYQYSIESMDSSSRFFLLSLTNSDGEVVLRQERSSSYINTYGSTYLEINGAEQLPAGTYTLAISVGDKNFIQPLGRQDIEVVEGFRSGAHVSYELRSTNLTCYTQTFAAEAYVECLPSQLPSDVTLQLVDLSSDTVVASSSDYTMLAPITKNSSASTANDADEDGGYVDTRLLFHLDLGSRRLASGSGLYALRLTSKQAALLSGDTGTLYVDSNPALFGSFNEDTLTWTGTAEGLPAGSYDAWTSDKLFTGLTLQVDEDGSASLVFPTDPYLATGNTYISLYADWNGSSIYFYFFQDTDDGSGKPRVSVSVEDLFYVSHKNSSTGLYIDWMLPMPESDKNFPLQAAVTGAPAGCTYQLECYNGDGIVASGPIDAPSGFTVTVPTVYENMEYCLAILDSEGFYIGQTNFRFRSDKALGFRSSNDFYNSNGDTLELFPLNMDASEVQSLAFGYTDAEGSKPLQHTVTNGVVTLDVSAMPHGIYRLWATYFDTDGNWTASPAFVTDGYKHFPKGSTAAVTVKDLEVTTNASGDMTAAVTYNGTPTADVLMDICLRSGDALTYVGTRSIGRGSYTIDSGALGLNGSYVFYFYYADGTSLGIKQADFVNEYSVTFLDWDGKVLKTEAVAPGGSATAPDTTALIREGYQFTGWSCGFDKVESNLIVTACYSKNTVTVTFFAGAGIGGPVPVTLTNGATLSDPGVDPQRDGYDFTGWYTTPACTRAFQFETTPVTADTILYAGWEATRFSIYESSAEIDISASEACAGERVTVTLTDDSFWYTALQVWDANSEDTLLQELTPRQEGFGIWSVSFTMPATDVSLTAVAVQNPGSLSITSSNAYITSIYINCYEVMYFRTYDSLSPNSGVIYDFLPYGTYYVSAYSDGYSWYESVTISAENPNAELILTAPELYNVQCTLTLPEGVDANSVYLYAYGKGDNYSNFSFVYNDCSGRDFTFDLGNVPNDTYTLYVQDNWGQLYPVDSTFTVNGANLTHKTAVIQPLSTTVTLEELVDDNGRTLGAQTATLVLERKVNGNYWEGVYYLSGAAASDTVYLFPYTITEAGEYRVRLDYLTLPNGAGLAYESTPVTFTVTESELASGQLDAGTLTYSRPLNVLDAFSGPGNLVALSKSEAYPGDYVDLTIRYNTYSPVQPTFTVTLPEGVSCTNAVDGKVVITPEKAALSNTLYVPLTLTDTATGTLSIPVEVTLGSRSAAFGTAPLSVAGVTLYADPAVTPGQSFTVYGEAAPDSTVSIVDMDRGVTLVSVPVVGRFYSTQLQLSAEGTYTLQAQVKSNGNVISSQPATVVAKYAPITISKVLYNYDFQHNWGTEAALNPKLNIHTFWQYVDMDLLGYDLPVAVVFENDDNICSVDFLFCGSRITAQSQEYNGERVWYATFDAGTWGGSGLKTITAEVTTCSCYHCDDSCCYYRPCDSSCWCGGSTGTYSFDAALVNLLIDPSGVVTDENGEPMAGVTVVCQVKDENGSWVDLDASAIGQVNPQVTDEDGRYGWNVPEGTYRVLAYKEGYNDYDSLTDPSFSADVGGFEIPPARNDINFSMTPSGTFAIYPTATDGVTVSASAASAACGETVTLTVSNVAEGLLVDTVEVTTASGKAVEVRQSDAALQTQGDTAIYSFQMPGEDVSYKVTTKSDVASSMSITSAAASGAVQVSFTKLEQNALLLTAFYDEDGRLVGTQSSAVTAGATSARSTAALTGTPETLRVFLLDPTTRKPLLESKHTTLS